MSDAHPEVVNLGEFRNRVAELVRTVEETGQTITIARRGEPVAELRPVAKSARRSMKGSVKFAPGVDLTQPVVALEEWEAAR